MSNIYINKYVPPYQQDFHSLPWYEKDFMTYIDWLKYKEMKDNPNEYFKKAKVINLDVINHHCRGNKLQRAEKEYKTIDKTDLKDYPEKESN